MESTPSSTPSSTEVKTPETKKPGFFSRLLKRNTSDRHPLDKSDMEKTIEEMSVQIQTIRKLASTFQIKNSYDAYAFGGVGGSAAPVEIFKSYVRSEGLAKPLFIIREYELPPLPKNTLIFIMSYSGNTEEALSLLRDAKRNDHDVVLLTAGGKLAETARIYHLPHVMIPQGLQPRQATAYFFFCLLQMFENAGLINAQDKYIAETIAALQKPIYKKMAQQLAETLTDKVPIIYTTDRYRGVAHKWKINFNENAKIPAFYNIFPELNHNEMIGFTGKLAQVHFILLRDEQEHPRNLKRMAITKRLLKKYDYPVTEVVVKGNNYLTKLFSALYIGDWTSYMLALQYGKDPSPVALVEEFKDLMNEE